VANEGGCSGGWLVKELNDSVSEVVHRACNLYAALDSRSRSTGLFSRMLAIVSDTFFRATASTERVVLAERSPV